jgi:hypothetical protein
MLVSNSSGSMMAVVDYVCLNRIGGFVKLLGFCLVSTNTRVALWFV